MLGVFSSSYEGFYLKWEPNQNFENSAHFDENFQILHIGPYVYKLLREGFQKKKKKLGLLAQPKVSRCPDGVLVPNPS